MSDGGDPRGHANRDPRAAGAEDRALVIDKIIRDTVLILADEMLCSAEEIADALDRAEKILRRGKLRGEH